MNNDKFRNKYRIPSARAMWHDYSGGIYFITVCTKNRAHYFGEIVCDENDTQTMHLTPIGQFLTDQIINVAIHYSYTEIPLFVVMPNHFHIIAFIENEKIPYQRRNVELYGDCRDTLRIHTATEPTINEKMRQIDTLKGWLSVVVGGIKSSVTKFANENGIEFSWQPRFDDRIIRNWDELQRIADYIEHNVACWNTDCFNAAAVTTPPP